MTEAEYMTLTEATKKALWLRSLVDNLSLSHELTVIHCDSQIVIHLVKNQMYHEQTKHIDVMYYFILVIMSRGAISMKKIAATENPTHVWN